MSTTRKPAQNPGKTKADKLRLHKETIKDLSPRGAAKLMGGYVKSQYCQGTGGGDPGI